MSQYEILINLLKQKKVSFRQDILKIRPNNTRTINANEYSFVASITLEGSNVSLNYPNEQNWVGPTGNLQAIPINKTYRLKNEGTFDAWLVLIAIPFDKNYFIEGLER